MNPKQEQLLNQQDILIKRINEITVDFLKHNNGREGETIEHIKSLKPKFDNIKTQYQELDRVWANFYNTKPNLFIKLIFKYKHKKIAGVIKAVTSLEKKLAKY